MKGHRVVTDERGHQHKTKSHLEQLILRELGLKTTISIPKIVHTRVFGFSYCIQSYIMLKNKSSFKNNTQCIIQTNRQNGV